MTSPVDYIARGWQILPCHHIERGRCTCGNPRCETPGKHPRTQHGFKDASSDINVINGWIKRFPKANWAVRTGPENGIAVIDIDPRNGGYDSFHSLQDARGPMPETLRSATGGGGRHLFYATPPGYVIPSRKPWPGIEFKADGGYVILPESNHVSGMRYHWLNWEVQGITPLPPDIAKIMMNGAASNGVAGSGTVGGDLAETVEILNGLPQGERDDGLFRWACRLRRQVGDGGRRIVELAVLDVASKCSPPFPPDVAMRKVEQAWQQDHDDSFVDWQMGDSWEPGEPTQDHPIHPLTDLGNAYRFYDAFGNDVLFVQGWGWLAWTQLGWQKDSQGVAPGLTHQLSGLILTDAKKIEQQGADIKTITMHTNWARRSQSAATMNNALHVAMDIPQMRRSVEQFDSIDHEICCLNGIVDLRTGQIRPVTKDDLVTKNTFVEYDPTFQLDAWNRFLWEACGGDIDLIKYLQRAVGYSLTGSNQEEKLFLVSGAAATGKSTFLDAVGGAFGGYATTTSPDTFMWSRNGQQPSVELARMPGIRLIAMSEIREGSGFNDNLIKAVTGGERITAKALYEMPFTYLPKFALWIGTNHDPLATDDALWRRIAKISFENALPPEKRDPMVKINLRDPQLGGKAVLAWAVAGAMEWYQTGLMQPYAVTMSTWGYHQDQDQFQQFINDCIQQQEHARTPLQAAFSAYRIWCEQTGGKSKNRASFARMMRDRGFKSIIDENGQESYINIIVSTPFVGSNMYQ
jgi:P4 family phage/plasmid primase-like protien